MKYETPELTALTRAINAIQSQKEPPYNAADSTTFLTETPIGAYQDWE